MGDKINPAIAACVLILSCAQASAQPTDWAKSQKVDIALSSFKFDPSIIHLRHGEVYTLHLHNLSGGGHDFVAKDFFAKATLASSARQVVKNGEVELEGSGNADVTLIAPSAGAYEVHCSHFLHETMGMKGQIVVE